MSDGSTLDDLVAQGRGPRRAPADRDTVIETTLPLSPGGQQASDTHVEVVVLRHGGPERLTLRRARTREPVGDQVRVRVRAAGVAFGDVLLREGIRRDPRPPVVPGYDVSGVVDAVGPDAPGELLGQAVAAWTRGAGGYSEVLLTPAWAVVAHPGSLDDTLAVSVVLNYVTAWQMLHRVARTRAGDRILVHGAAGGVGTALLQLAALLDVEVYGTASARKHELVRTLGATPIDYTSEDFVEVLRQAGGADAVFDAVGGGHWRRSMAALTGAGTVVGFGFSAGTVNGRRSLRRGIPALLRAPVVTPASLMQRVRTVSGYRIELLAEQRPDWFGADLRYLLGLLVDGRIAPIVEQTYPLTEVVAAHEHLGVRSPVGKLVLTLDRAAGGSVESVR